MCLIYIDWIDAYVESSRELVVFMLSYCLFMVCVSCRDVRYDFHIKTMFDSSLPSVVL